MIEKITFKNSSLFIKTKVLAMFELGTCGSVHCIGKLFPLRCRDRHATGDMTDSHWIEIYCHRKIKVTGCPGPLKHQDHQFDNEFVQRRGRCPH